MTHIFFHLWQIRIINRAKRMKDFLILFLISERALPQLIQTFAVRRHGIKVGPARSRRALFYENYISHVSYPFPKTVDSYMLHPLHILHASHRLCYFEHHVFAH